MAVRFEKRLAASFGRGRAWLTGDAGHMTGPVAAQSMNVGIREAFDLAETIADVLRNGASESTLEAYGKARIAEWRSLLGLDAPLAPGPHTDACLRVVSGAPKLYRSHAYLDGMVEIQDAASQAAAAYARARPGETILDFCAGAGGKALAFACAMSNEGSLHAHDISPERLSQLDQRARRAGARITCHSPQDLDTLGGQCDLVFVDAPCSGSGAWRRNPDAKWRLTPERLQALIGLQSQILLQAAAMVRPGGRLVYATCSVLDAENSDQIAALSARQTNLRPARPSLTLLPGNDGDGFFACELLRPDE